MTFSVSSEQPPSVAPDLKLVPETVRVSRELQATLLHAEALGAELDELLGQIGEESSDQAVADVMRLDTELVRRVREGNSSLTLLMTRYLEAAVSSES